MVTLRRRLAAALLAVVLGPLVFGAVAVGVTATRIADDQARERLRAGGAVVATAVNAVCQRARAAAESLAAVTAGGAPPGRAASLVVSRGLAEAAAVETPTGAIAGRAGDVGPASAYWGDCAHGQPSGQRPTRSDHALVAATVDLRRADGARIGRVRAALTVSAADLGDLAGVTGVTATALVAGESAVSALPPQSAGAVAEAVARGRDRVVLEGRTYRLVIDEPAPGRPLRTVLATPAPDPSGVYSALVLVVVGAAAAALVAANLLARALTRPLQEVASAAQLVADGDLGTRLPVRAYDEVGRLAATFNRMTRGMEAYIAALTAGRDQLRGTLALLGDTMSSTNDVDRILDVVLESVVATTAAQSGIVLLATEHDVLTGRSGLGMAARGVRVDAVRLNVGEGLLGRVADRREARHGRVGDGVVLSPREPDCRTFIAVPIVGPPHPPRLPAGRMLGVLALYDRLGGDDFDDGDLVTVRTFAAHVAVAVENALLHSVDVERTQALEAPQPVSGSRTLAFSRIVVPHTDPNPWKSPYA